MKILVIGLEGLVPERLLGDERLTNFRRLMEAGCYGRTPAGARWTTELTLGDQIAREGKRAHFLGAPARPVHGLVELREELVGLRSVWDYCQFVESGPGLRDDPLHLDEELGRVVELLTEDTIVLVVSVPSAQRLEGDHTQAGAFILAGAASPLRGELHGAHLLDLAPTLLELGGYHVPSSMQGKSLLTAPPGEDADAASAEEIVRERLRGLGYLG